MLKRYGFRWNKQLPMLFGNPVLPWPCQIPLYGRNDATDILRQVAKDELRTTNPARCYWNVVYAAGRAGNGKTEIGRQLPHILVSTNYPDGKSGKVETDPLTDAEVKLLANAAYLFIDCNGGGDGFQEADLLLEPSSRLGWRLLAAICRGTLTTPGVRGLRNHLAEPDLIAARKLKSMFPNVSELISALKSPSVPLETATVIGALAKDLRSSGSSTERVAIIVQVDEHQLMWGKGLAPGATEAEKLEKHKEFLYGLCFIRGAGTSSWCLENNVFLLPIFTGTASGVLRELTIGTLLTKKHVPLSQLSAVDAREFFISLCHESASVRSPNQTTYQAPHPSWLTEDKTLDGTAPIDLILSELGRVPRLIKDKLLQSKEARALLTDPFNHGALHRLFGIVRTFGSGTPLMPEMTRLIVSGVKLEVYSVVHEKAIWEHEFDGDILTEPDPTKSTSIRVPAVDYRAAVSKVADLKMISDFANLNFTCREWSGDKRSCKLPTNSDPVEMLEWPELWEGMMRTRFMNIIYVYKEILKRRTATLSELYPGCFVEDNVHIRLPTMASCCERQSFCTTSKAFNRFGCQELLQVPDRECEAWLLARSHPGFDTAYMLRAGKKVVCILEQLKHREVPTKGPLCESAVRIDEAVCKAMKQMSEMASDSDCFLSFVLVLCDGRVSDVVARSWVGEWKAMKEKFGLPIATTVVGSKTSLPTLFPCLEHRFALLDTHPASR